MTNKFNWAAALSAFAASVGLAQPPAPATVEQGTVQGTSEDGLTVYRGIPFAAPPIGELRWHAPQPAAKWKGVRQATKFGPKPIQGSRTGPDMSEDRLYEISDAVSTYWVNFAKRGDPNGEGVPASPAFRESNPQVMYFNQTPYPGPVPSAESLKVLDAYFAWRRTPEGEAWAQ
jgi:carboxylesterase type B